MTTITLEEFNDILEFATINNIAYDYFEGSLLDNAIIYNMDNELKIYIDGKTSKYIIIKEKYLNEWSSILEVIFTDDSKIADEYYYQFEGNIEQ